MRSGCKCGHGYAVHTKSTESNTGRGWASGCAFGHRVIGPYLVTDRDACDCLTFEDRRWWRRITWRSHWNNFVRWWL